MIFCHFKFLLANLRGGKDETFMVGPGWHSLATPLYAPLPTNFQYCAVAHGDHYLICAVCDVTISPHIHVCKPTVWRSLLTQHTYYSTRTLLIRCTVYVMSCNEQKL